MTCRCTLAASVAARGHAVESELVHRPHRRDRLREIVDKSDSSKENVKKTFSEPLLFPTVFKERFRPEILGFRIRALLIFYKYTYIKYE